MKQNWLSGITGAAAVAVIAISIIACGDDSDGWSVPQAERARVYADTIVSRLDEWNVANLRLTALMGGPINENTLARISTEAGNLIRASRSVRAVSATGTGSCVEDADRTFDRAMDTSIAAMEGIQTAARTNDPSDLAAATELIRESTMLLNQANSQFSACPGF